MNNKEILKNAPEGATHYSKEQNQYWVWYERKPFFNGEMTIDYPDDLRSLKDIKRIVELEKQNQDYAERIKSALYGCLLDEMGNRGEGGFYNYPNYKLILKILEGEL